MVFIVLFRLFWILNVIRRETKSEDAARPAVGISVPARFTSDAERSRKWKLRDGHLWPRCFSFEEQFDSVGSRAWITMGLSRNSVRASPAYVVPRFSLDAPTSELTAPLSSASKKCLFTWGDWRRRILINFALACYEPRSLRRFWNGVETSCVGFQFREALAGWSPPLVHLMF